MEPLAQHARSANKNRFLAAFVDNFIGGLATLLAISAMPEESTGLRIAAFSCTYLGYFWLCEALWSRTLGKWVCGLQVRRLNGEPCGWRAASIRTLLRIVETNPILFGGLPAGLMVLFTKRRQRLGDWLAGTVVVSSKTVAQLRQAGQGN